MSQPAHPEPSLSARDRGQLERRLGEPYRLDGSFGSLWAVEALLETVRRAPSLGSTCDWLPSYLGELFARAYSDMGLEVSRPEPGVLVTREPAYRIDLVEDCRRLIDPPRPFPTLFGTLWLGMPELNLAAAPWYGLATVLQNHKWAEAQHRLIGECRERLDRAFPWLVRQQAWSAVGPDRRLGAAVFPLVEAMVWPPVAYHMNERGEHNLPRVEQAFQATTDREAAATVLLRIAAGQDRFLSLLAAQACMAFDIAPRSPLQARAMKRAMAFFDLARPSELRHAETIESLADPREAPVDGTAHRRYRAAQQQAERGQWRAAHDELTALLDVSPKRAAYWCFRGYLAEQLERDDDARRDYDRALELRSDYWQARTNRGVLLSRRQRFEEADRDLFAAQRLRPADPDTRHNLLLNYLCRRQTDRC